MSAGRRGASSLHRGSNAGPRTAAPAVDASRGAADRAYPIWLVAIFLLALLVRLTCLVQLRTSPLMDVVMGDSAVYDRWARSLAAGNWMGDEVFFQAPLYPYFVAAVYTLFGESTWTVRLAQAGIGALSCVVLAAAGRAWFSPRVGWLTGVLLALYAPAVYYDVLIQKEVLALFFVAVLLLLMAWHEERPRGWTAVGMGLSLGLLALTRENGLILVPVVGVWLFLARSGTLSRRARGGAVAGLVAGLAVVLVPVGVRNQLIGGRFLITTSNMGSNLYIGNQPGARGYYLPLKEWRAEAKFEQQDARDLAEQATGRTLTPGEVSRYWLRRTLRHIAAHPGEWVRLMMRKWLMVWNASEHMDTESIEAYAEESSTLKLLNSVMHFGVMVPLAAAGVWLTRGSWRRYAVWYVMILSFAAGITLFFVFGRFRYPMVALLLPFAGAGVVGWMASMRRLDFKAVAASLPFAAAAAAACHLPAYRQHEPLAIAWTNVAGALTDLGRFEEAIAYFERSRRRQPNRPETFYMLAMTHERFGDDEEAEKYYRLAVAGPDQPADVLEKLANLLVRRGNAAEAAAYFRRMVQADPGGAETRYRAAYGLALTGRRDEARQEYREAVRLRPDHVGALNNLAMLSAEDGNMAEARALFLQALRLAPGNADLHYNVGLTWLEENRVEEACRCFEAALHVNPDHQPARESRAACE